VNMRMTYAANPPSATDWLYVRFRLLQEHFA
jgi:hypothetical protein